MRICAYAVMPNHWHLLLWPECDGELTAFMQRLTITHVRRWQEHKRESGTGTILTRWGVLDYASVMPRTARVAPGGMVFHVLNRGVARMQLFEKAADYQAFEQVLRDTLRQ